VTQNKAKVCKNLIITLVFEKNADFFVENCRKSHKIVIITSTLGGRGSVRGDHPFRPVHSRARARDSNPGRPQRVHHERHRLLRASGVKK
jgi:hypothetical protein